MKRFSSLRLAIDIIASLSLLASLAAPTLSTAARAPVALEDAGVFVTLAAPPLTIEPGSDGYDRFLLDGFSAVRQPGQPVLPARVYTIALPPAADLSALSLEVVSTTESPLDGLYHVETAADMRPQDILSGGLGGEFGAVSAPNSPPKEIFPPSRFGKGGRGVRSSSSLSPFRLLSGGQFRSYRFARLLFSPVLYDPLTGAARLVTQATLRIHYPAVSAQSLPAPDAAPGDSSLFYNFSQAQNWYPDSPVQPGAAAYDYVIVTTSDIRDNSQKLAVFLDHKRALGYSPLVITEQDYDPAPAAGFRDRAGKIRAWLQSHYLEYGIRYVLLIGNPDPYNQSSATDTAGDVPMLMCWPRTAEGDYPESVTDFFYSELTSQLDASANTRPCEWADYEAGGMDFAPEVLAGRIPVYNRDFATLDSVFQKIIDYENDSDPSWRRSALLPVSFSDAQTDGAYLAERMKADYLDSAGFGSWTMYQQGSRCAAADSAFASSEELRGGSAVPNRWSAGAYGLLIWWAHGSETQARVGYGVDCDDGPLFDSTQVASLSDDHPSFTYLNSCTNGYPELSTNLGYSLLKHGAVASVASSRVSFYYPGEQSFEGSLSNAGIAYGYARRLSENLEAGRALAEARSDGLMDQSALLMNLLDFNLYGDPSLRLLQTVPLETAPAVSTLSPDHVPARWGDFTLTVTGQRFEPGAVARWNGSDLATTFNSDTQLSAAVPAALVMEQGSALVSVANPGESLSADATFTIDPPGQACDASFLELDLTSVFPYTGANNTPIVSTDRIDSYPGVPWDESGPEIAYSLVPPASGTVTFQLDSPTADLDLFLLSGRSGQCLSGHLLQFADSVLTAALNAHETYYLVIDGRGGAAGSYTLTINCPDCSNPVPVLDTLEPAQVIARPDGFTLAASGSGFVPGSYLEWDGHKLSTTYLSATRLEAQVPAGFAAAPAEAALQAVNLPPGGGKSNPLPFTVREDPAGTCTPAADFTLGDTVQGSTDTPAATRQIDRYPDLPSNPTLSQQDFSGAEMAYRLRVDRREQVTLDLYAASAPLSLFLIADQNGCHAVDLLDTRPGLISFMAEAGQTYYAVVDGPGGTTGTYTLAARCPGCQNPGPHIDGLEPALIPAGSGAQSLVVRGEDFLPGATVFWDRRALETTVNSSSELAASVPPDLTAQPGKALIRVANPGPQGRVSPTQSETERALATVQVAASGACYPARDLLTGDTDTRRNDSPGSTNTLLFDPVHIDHNGPEFTYRFIPTVDGLIEARLSNAARGLHLAIFDGAAGDCKIDDNLLTNGAGTQSTAGVAGHPYYLVIDGYNGAVGSYTLTVSDTSRLPADAGTVNVNRPVFEWPSSSGATSYVIALSTRPDLRSPFLSVRVTRSRFVPSADLPAGRMLYWRVTPYAGTRKRAPLPIWSFTSGAAPSVAALRSPTGGAVLNRALPKLDWTTPSLPRNANFARYELQIASDPYFSTLILDLREGLTDRLKSDFTLPGPLPIGGTYYWRVRAVAAGEQFGRWSAAGRFLVRPAAPVLLFPPDGEHLTPNPHTLAWDPVPGATRYTIQISRSSTFSTVLYTATTASTSYTRVLRSAKPYYWRVRAISPITTPWSPVRKFWDTE